MNAIKLAAIFSGVRSRKDRSYSLTFETQELRGVDAAAVLDLHQSICWLLVAATEDAIDQAEVPDYRPDNQVESKTPSQRLRAVIFLTWKQHGSQGDFETFYRQTYEHIIDVYKAKLDDGESL